VELDWAEGHRHLMFEYSWSLPMHQSTVTKKTKFRELDIRKGIGVVVQKNKIWCKTELPMMFPLQPMYPKKIV
jgi:hypothetical protein